ncbi:hypothetical protein ACH4E8_26760 [Streptomyces sp. NPDC017979]|uniref:hypothetical protein n=1 Tax=Streptomyces sp. NPDC017979 TaxID=3365024 RepID=UPI0037B07227
MSVRVLAGVVGRRNLLRYLAVGVGAVVVSACSGNGSAGGVRAQALRAFLEGTWEWEANRDLDVGERTTSGSITIGDGTWSLPVMSGTWTYTDGTLDILHEGQGSHLKLLEVPGEVLPKMSKSLACSGEFGRVQAAYDGTELRLSFDDDNLVLKGTRVRRD